MVSKQLIYLMQIAIIISMVIIQLMLQWIIIKWWEVPFTISSWALGIAVAYLVYKKNILINSILMSLFASFIFVTGMNIMGGNFFDIQHIITLIIIIYLIYNKSLFKMSYVLISTGVFALWTVIVWVTGIAYQYFYLETMIAFAFVMGVNIIIVYGLAHYRGYLYNELDNITVADTLKEISTELDKIKGIK